MKEKWYEITISENGNVVVLMRAVERKCQQFFGDSWQSAKLGHLTDYTVKEL